MARLNSTESGMNLTWIRHIWKYAWIRHESDSMEIWFKGQKIGQDLCEWCFGLVVWNFGKPKCWKSAPMLISCWIHAFPLYGLEINFCNPKIETANPNRRRKSRFFLHFPDTFWLLGWCWLHVEFMLDSCQIKISNIIFSLVSDSCRIQAKSVILRFGVVFGFFKILAQIWLELLRLNESDKLVLKSCWFHFHLEFQNALCNTLHDNGVEFMLNSCWIQAKPWRIPKFANQIASQAFNWTVSVIYY